jgi:Icc-related predicted phosphoesterase
MKVAMLSDTHEFHNLIDYFPEADVFVHAGDFTMIGESNWVSNFNAWLGRLPYKHKIVIAGNHDRTFDIQLIDDARSYGKEKLNNATYLLNEGYEIGGKKFWGSPYTPFFLSDFWKFHYGPGEADKLWSQIPENLDMLITHGPPFRIRDYVGDGYAGCHALRNRLDYMRENGTGPKVHVFGHIHSAYGWDPDTNSFNVSGCHDGPRGYTPRRDPIRVVEI